MSQFSDPDLEIDCRGLMCPEPVLRTRGVIAGMAGGQVLRVVADDPLAEVDLAVFCEHAGHQLLHAETVGGEVRVTIRVSPGPKPAAG